MVAPETEVFVIGEDGTEILRTVLPPGEYVIGRMAGCDLQVNADLVSRKHARLIITDEEAHIEDLGSSNGTYLDGQPITESVRLAPDGHQIRVGSATMSIRRRQPGGGYDSPAPLADADSVRRLLPEELLRNGKYHVGREVARGGMGSILSAEEVAIRREVAMKLMRHAPSEIDLLRFVEEAQITGQLEHPNIVPVHELSVNEHGQPFYTMKMVQGITLKKVLELLSKGVDATVEKYTLPVLLTIFQKVCDGLAFAHAKSVIHRDLKPENIMLGGYGEVLLMDWGLAKVVNHAGRGETSLDAVNSVVCSARFDGEVDMTMTGTILGTPQYMSPEQARGEVDTLDQRSDIYSLGALLYQILALRPSVTAKKPLEIVDKIVRGDLLPLTPKFPNRPIPDSLAAVVRKAMALDAAERYASVHELQADIAAYQGGYATSAEHATTWKQFQLLIARNKKAALTAAASLVFVLLLSAGFTARVMSARNQAEAQQKRAIAGEKRAEETLATAGRTLLRLKFEKARSAFDEGRGDEGLAWLAAVLRQDPQNRVAATWLMSALTDRNYPLPSAPRIVIPKANQNANEATAALRFSPDGSGLLVASRAGGLSLWNSLTGQALAPMRTTADFRQAWWLADVKSAATTHYGGREVDIWNTENGQLLGKTRPSHEGQVTWVVPSQDGRFLATADDKYNVQAWDVDALAPLGKPIRLPNDVQSLDISPNNRWVSVRTGITNETRVFDIASGEQVGVAVPESNGWPRFHPSAPRVLVPKVAQNRWQIRDVTDGRFVESKEGHSASGVEAVFSPGGMYLATASDDLRARVWDARTGAPVTAWLRHGGRVMRPEFSPEGLRLLTFGTDYICRLWNVLNGELVAEPWHLPEGQYDPNQCRFSPDGAHVAIATRARTVQVYDVREGRQLPTIIKDSGAISGFVVSPDGLRCAVAFNSATPRVRFFDTATSEKVGTDLTHARGISVLALSPDGRQIATGSADFTAQIWDVESGQPVGKPLLHETAVNMLAFSSDGRLLATASVSKDLQVRIWDVTTGQTVGEPIKMTSTVTRLAFSPDRSLLVVATDAGTGLYNVTTRQRTVEISRAQSNKDVRFNRDGSLLAVATERDGVIVVNPATGKEAFPALLHENAVMTVRFSPDGTRLLSASLDGTARLWDTQTGLPAIPALRPGDVLNAAEFSADGASVATAARDGTVRLWDATTGDPLSEPLRHGAEVRTLQFSADGRRLITAIGGDWIHIWDLAPAKFTPPTWLASLAEAVAGRRLSSQGEMTSTTMDEYWRLREHLISRQDSKDPIEQWGAWFIGDRASRPASPWGARTVTAALDKIRMHDTAANLERLLRYQADDPSLLGRFAKNLSLQAKTVATASRDSEYLTSIGSRVFVERLLAAQRAAQAPAYISGSPRGFPARDASATSRELDLTWHYNMILDSPWISDDATFKLSLLPKGLVTLDNVRWDIRGLLFAAGPKQPSTKPMAARVEGVPVLQKAGKIHTLHTCAWNSPAGTKIASYVLHYVDGETRELPIVYGEDLREWTLPDSAGAGMKARVAWTPPPGGRALRLYHRAYDNPRPDVEIASLDLVGAGVDAAPIVVALTLE